MIKECIPLKVTVEHNSKGCTGVRGKKKVGESVLDSEKSICTVSEVERSLEKK